MKAPVGLDSQARSNANASEWSLYVIAIDYDPRRVAEYGPSVLAVCRRHLSNTDLAWEAYQETFLAYAARRHALDHSRSLLPWFRETARRCSLATLRRETRQCGEALEEEPRVSVIDQRESAGRRESVSALLEELESLPASQRELIRLVYQEGMSHREVSQRTGCPLGSVHSQVESARRKLHRKLTQRGVVMSAILLTFLLADNAHAGSVRVRYVGRLRAPRLIPKVVSSVALMAAVVVMWAGWRPMYDDSHANTVLPITESDVCLEYEDTSNFTDEQYEAFIAGKSSTSG